jgi:hypothetical protein
VCLCNYFVCVIANTVMVIFRLQKKYWIVCVCNYFVCVWLHPELICGCNMIVFAWLKLLGYLVIYDCKSKQCLCTLRAYTAGEWLQPKDLRARIEYWKMDMLAVWQPCICLRRGCLTLFSTRTTWMLGSCTTHRYSEAAIPPPPFFVIPDLVSVHGLQRVSICN